MKPTTLALLGALTMPGAAMAQTTQPPIITVEEEAETLGQAHGAFRFLRTRCGADMRRLIDGSPMPRVVEIRSQMLGRMLPGATIMFLDAADATEMRLLTMEANGCNEAIVAFGRAEGILGRAGQARRQP